MQINPNEPPPAKAGSLNDLVGTAWQLSQGQTLQFGQNGGGQGTKENGFPLPMRYELDANGVIRVYVGTSARSGTWDGEHLTLNGEALQPVAKVDSPSLPLPSRPGQ